MVSTKHVENRLWKRYKVYIVIGLVILFSQIYLALHFVSLNTERGQNVNKWVPHNGYIETGDTENSVNSARRAKDGLAIDDEDNSRGFKKIATKKNGNNTRLRLEELDFVPACEITTREAISAMHRAKTQRCKQKIANITCLIQQGLLYPKQLPNYCPSNGFVRGKSLGCFKDDKAYRLLKGYYGTNKKFNSPESCIRLCLQSGFQYAGVQYSIECFCGNEEPPSTARLADSSCNMKCPVDPHLACGGYYTINVYQTGISKFNAQIAASASTHVKPPRVVFLLTLNGRALRQVKRLIKMLFQKDHYFFIHVDSRQDYLFRELIFLEAQFPNVKLTRNRHATIWGGASLLRMLMHSMRELLTLPWRWDFVLNLSESDYPVKLVTNLTQFLGANRGKNFVKSHGREVQRFIQKQGLDKTFVECDAHMWRTGERHLPAGVQIDGGSDWIALSRDFVEYVQEEDELVRGLLVYFEHTLLPAESFFHTVLRNSRFCHTYIDNNLHVTNWKRKLGCKCQYKHVVDWCGCSPNDFKPEDWSRIQNTESRQLFFARKFEPVVNQAVVLQLEQWLLGVEPRDVSNLKSYWQSVYHHLDLSPQPDDALLTVAESAARLRTKLLGSGNCVVRATRVLEVTSHLVDDAYASTLILYEVSLPATKNRTALLETAIKPSTATGQTTSPLAKRLKYLRVSTDYDQKEQMLRNFAEIIGPYSEPTLAYVFTAAPNAKSANLTVLWLDPAGRLAELNDLYVDDSYVAGHVSPSGLRQPLLPGIWRVKLVASRNEEIVADVQFLVTPLYYLAGNRVSQKQVVFLHGGDVGPTKEFDARWDRFLPEENRDTLEALAMANAKRFGPDLLEWIDTLVGKFYRIGHVCVASTDNNNNNDADHVKDGVCGIGIQKCRETSWSSLAPDPKSFIGKVNETTGSFDLW